MSILGNDLLLGSGDEGYNLTRSLRFRSSASAYLSRTPASSGSLTTMTWSYWVKLGLANTGTDWDMFSAGASDGASIRLQATNNKLRVYDYNGSAFSVNLITTQVFRDPSAWYHVVIAIDTTQATSSNRAKLYINGSQVTAFDTAVYPSLNQSMYRFNSNVIHNIGRQSQTASQYFDGYLTEVNFIDGQALTPSSFGETDTITGVWKPKRYAGTYGTNGFYLPFTDNSALTTSSNVGLGKDFSGNGNYWTTNNISITSGTTYDSMTDVPTLTSATAANFAVMNPLEHPTTFVAPTNANLTQNCNTSAWTLCVPTINIPNSSGLWQWEFVQTGTANGANAFGVCLSTVSATTTGDPSSRAGCSGVSNASGAFINGSTSGSITYPTTGTTVTCLYDATNLTLQVFQDGTSKGTITGLPSGDVRPFVAASSSNGSPTFDMNFGQRPFGYDKGGKALNTYNLPTSTIVKGNTVMDATTYTGNGGYLEITNAGSMKSDFLWIKSRSSAQNNVLLDSVRGDNKYLVSNSTAAEVVSGGPEVLFLTNGFAVGGNAQFGANGTTYVGWQWQAGQGTTSSNTSGTITSTVSVNASAGFSVVTWTANGSANQSIGHGLGVAPQLVIVKDRTTANNWNVWFTGFTANEYLRLNTTAAKDSYSTLWYQVPTSSVFYVGTSGTAVNYQNGDTYVAYCFAPIAGYSAFGSYTGNGSSDGPFVYTGFRPKFVLAKRSDSGAYDWFQFDTARETYNVMYKHLKPNGSNAEDTGVNPFLDVVSNGFKLRTANNMANASGGTYIYMAFAENPTKFALAR